MFQAIIIEVIATLFCQIFILKWLWIHWHYQNQEIDTGLKFYLDYRPIRSTKTSVRVFP